MRRLSGKVALVTGGARNVGKAISKSLALEGAHVIVNYFHSHEEAKRTKAEIEALGGSVDLIRASVARPEQVERMFATISERYGRLDILVNNAANGALVPVAELTDEHLDRAIDTNLKGGLRCARAAAPLMAGRGGSIITISALGSSQMVMANYLACAPAKAAAETVTRYLAVEFAPLNIRVNTASAAMLVSEVADAFPDAKRMQETIRRATPFGRLGTAEEFAKVVVFLASDDSRWITGQTILADGGLSLGAALLSPPRDPVPVGPQSVPPAPAPAAAAPAPTPSVPTPAPVPAPAPSTPAPVVADRSGEPVRVREQTPVPTTAPDGTVEDEIAVVGMGMVVAGANSPDEFWELRTHGAELFVPVPEDRWDRTTFHSANPDDEDKSYQDTCVFVTGFVPDAEMGRGLPPGEHDLTTLWLRHSLVQALRGVRRDEHDRYSFSVGYTPDGSQHLEEAGVIASVTDHLETIATELQVPAAQRDEVLTAIRKALGRRYRRGSHDPTRFLPHRVGQLAMANLLPDDTELQMVDTACSSSLYAIDMGVKGLLMGKHDIAVCGGAFALAPRGTVLFAKLQGLSRKGAVHALDAGADGVIFADGAAVVVLKRLSRARADGDRVLAVLKTFGASSDGKGKAIYAPSAAGQDLAVRRALDPEVRGDDVDWIVAHATGTPAGDLAEFTTLRAHYGTERTSYVTSNKSLIGHTGWAAGVVSVIEVILGMARRSIPPQFRFTQPPADFRLDETRLEIPTRPVDWQPMPGRRRTAAVSGFGFGGTNAHLIVQEPTAAPVTTTPRTTTPPASRPRIAIVAWSAHLPGLSGDDAVREWLAGRRSPKSSFGEFYPRPPFARLKLPPPTVRTTDRCQLMILECAHNLRDQLGEFWQKHSARAGVFVGNLGPTRAAMLYANRCYLDDISQALHGDERLAGSPLLPRLLDQLRDRVRALIPPSNEDSFPGMMPNIIAARVANYFDLNGPNMTLDSGLASALTAIETASRYMRAGEIDFALAGGINGNSLPAYREILSGLLGPGVDELAEGAVMFALTTDRLAEQAGLTVLGYVDDLSVGSRPDADAGPDPAIRAAAADRIECGVLAPDNARYLGASGALAVLRALHRPAGRVTVACGEGDEATTVRLSLTVTGALATSTPEVLPASFGDATRYAPDRPTQVRRYVPRLREIDSYQVRDAVAFLPPGVVVLTDLPDLGPELGALPPDAVVLSTVPPTTDRPGWRYLPEVTPAAVQAALAGRRTPVRHLRVVADLGRSAPLPGCLTGGAESLIALHDATFLAVKTAYDDLAAEGATFVTVLLDALPNGTPHPFTGLFSGLIKCASLELSSCLTFGLFTNSRHLDRAVRTAERESAAFRTYPIVFDQDGRRLGYELTEEEAALDGEVPAQLGPDSVVLAFGGARGITAEILKAVARHFRPTIYLAGSNRIDDLPPEALRGSDEEFAATRKDYIRRRTRSGGTVAQANREFDRMVDARTAARNIAEMAAHCGAGRVVYLPCDVLDGQAVEATVARVLASHGRVDLLVNAPGRNRSASIRDKDFGEFTAIRGIKLTGYRNLKRAFAANPPRLWCNFGSLLGYFGQVGEPDYAAGNDFLASAATYAAAQPGDGTEFTIGWTLWEGVGMGANELTRSYFKRAGSYSHMAIDEGIHHFMRELHAANRAPSSVHIGDAERATIARFYPGYLEQQRDRALPGFYLRHLVSQEPGVAVFECPFDLGSDGYLAHHLVREQPTLPGTFVTEIAAEAARFLVRDAQVIAFEDLEFHHFLRVYPGVAAPPRRITARVLPGAGEVTTVEVRITGDVVSPTGVMLVRDRPHFTVRVLLHAEPPAAPRWEAWEPGGEVSVPDPYHVPSAPVRLTGPFEATTQTRLHPRGQRAWYQPNLPADEEYWSRFHMPVILLDALARTGVLSLVDGHLVPVAAPLSIRRVDLYEQANDRQLAQRYGGLELYVTPRGFGMTGPRPTNRFVAATRDGRVIAQMKDIRATVLGYVDVHTGAFVPPEAARPGNNRVPVD